MKNSITTRDLMFHGVHGLCRVTDIREDDGDRTFTLMPVVRPSGKVTFNIPESSLEASGFEKFITAEEGRVILDFLENGEGGEDESNDSHAWQSARMLRGAARAEALAPNARERQRLDRCIRGARAEYEALERGDRPQDAAGTQ